eukprot:5656374-Alexandrium_andersonii.AAC.1
MTSQIRGGSPRRLSPKFGVNARNADIGPRTTRESVRIGVRARQKMSSVYPGGQCPTKHGTGGALAACARVRA